MTYTWPVGHDAHDWETGTPTMFEGQYLEWYIDGDEFALGFVGGETVTLLSREQTLNMVAGLCHLLNLTRGTE